MKVGRSFASVLVAQFGYVVFRYHCGKAHRKAFRAMAQSSKPQDGLESPCLMETSHETSYDDKHIVCCPSFGSVCDDIAF
jgi:hypothetical protein